MASGADAVVQIGGPWTHRSVSANGTRFHAAEAGDGPLVLLLHGFPEFWWTWRHQLATLPAAGFRAVAVDLRGYGGSDKPPTRPAWSARWARPTRSWSGTASAA
jgi:pimeloyl-ACP methyl ester carboxylesterase